MSETPRYLIDRYLDWLPSEGLPVVEDFGVEIWRQRELVGAG